MNGDARHRAYLDQARFASLDGLRFLSIAPVIWHHATPGPLPGLLGKGPVGVELFFAISGFLITTRLLREQGASGTIAAGRFYARRTLRIFPLYYAVLALHTLRAWLLLPATDPARAHFFASLPFFASYTTNWFVDFTVTHPVIFAFSWSLATEEQFYLLWPWVVRASRGWLFPVSVALVLLGADQGVEHGLFVGAFPDGGLTRRMLASIATPICLGVLLAYTLHRPRSFAIASPILGHRLAAPIALALVFALLAADGAPLFAVHLALTALVGVCCVRNDHGLRRLTDAAPLRWIGEVSYGMYLLHVSVITAVKRAFPGGPPGALVIFALAFPLTALLAGLSHRFVERPFLRLGERFRAPR